MEYKRIVKVLEDNDRMDIIARSSCVVPNNHLHKMAKKYAGKACVEIGTYKGLSTAALAEFFGKVHTFDVLFQPDALEVFKMFGLGTKVQYKYESSLVHPESMTGEDYIHYSWLYGPGIRKRVRDLEFGFAFIDACHEVYDEVQKDFEAVKKCGTVLFHDYSNNFPNAKQFCNDIGCEPIGEFALWTK